MTTIAEPITCPLAAEPARYNEIKSRFNDGRTVTFRWLKHDAGDDHTYWAVLSCYHDASRHQFFATFGVEEVEDGVRRMALTGNSTIWSESVDRYNVKARERFVYIALDVVRELWHRDQRIRDIAAPVAELLPTPGVGGTILVAAGTPE